MRLAAALSSLAAVALWCAAGHAQDQPSEPARPETAPRPGEGVDPNDPWLWGDVAVLRGLDKVTAVTRDFEAPVGEDSVFFALTIDVKRCAKRPPEMAPEVIVGMEIYDRRTDGAGQESEPMKVFSGWMFGSSPALNPLEHPVYDVWVVDCIDTSAPTAPSAQPETSDGR